MLRNLLLTTCAAGALFCALASDARAHGGTYRGPGDVQGPPDPGGPTTPGDPGDPTGGGTPGGPLTPGGNGPGTPGGGPPGGGAPGGGSRGPTTRGVGLVKKNTSGDAFDQWHYWWEFNKDRFLDLRERLAASSTATNGGGFLVGAGKKSAAVASSRPSRETIDERIVPLLKSMLGEKDRDLLDSSVLALGRIVPSDAAANCLPEIEAALHSEHASVQQSAILGLGVLGSRDAVPSLVAILGDTPDGRKRLGENGKIQDLHRAFAAIALGYIGAADTIPVLVSTFEKLDGGDKTLRGSILVGLGLFQEGREEITAQLLDWMNDDKLDPDVAGQIPVALGRLGAAPAIPTLLKLATSRKSRERVEESAIIALGALANAGEREVVAALGEKIADGSNSQARHFAIIALADIAERALLADLEKNAASVEPIRATLLRQLAKSSRGEHEPWAALGLAIFGRRYPTGSIERSDIALRIVETFEDKSNPSRRGAFAIALGILDATSAGDAIQSVLEDSHDDDLRGYCAVAIGLLRHAPAKPTLHALLKLDRDAKFRLRMATALGLMGDHEATDVLIESFQSAHTLTVTSSLARAIGLIGDERAVPPLERLVGDRDATALSRGFGCVALGLLAEKTDRPWNARIAIGINYRTQIHALREVLDIL